MDDVIAICVCCGVLLTEHEQFYYEHTCEACEDEWHNRVEAWRHGALDEELDTLFDKKEPTKH